MIALALAGCSDNKTPGAVQEGTSFEDVEITVSATTGAILGVTVDEAIRPLEGVAVQLQGIDQPVTVQTDATGRFAFDDLEPGTYFIQAVKPGYAPAQTSAEAVAGDADPPIVRVLLARDVSQQPYVVAQQWQGFIVCTTSAVAVCGAPNIVSELLLCPVFDVCLGNVTDDRFGANFFFDENATMIQMEMVWKTTQTASPELTISMENLGDCEADGDSYIEYASGPSPIYNIADAADIEKGTIGGTCPIWVSIFSGDTAGTPAGATVNQRFDIYSHAFYGYTPFEGWRFTEHGEPPQPPQ